MTGRGWLPRPGDGRGQAALIAIIILLGITVLVGFGILFVGADAQGQSEEAVEDERISEAFRELGKQADTVARTDQNARTTNLDIPEAGDAAVREEHVGNITVVRIGNTGDRNVMVKRPLGAIRYTRGPGQNTYAMQAGAVFAEQENATTLLSPAAFAYDINDTDDRPTLTIPLVATAGEERMTGGNIRIEKLRSISPINQERIVEDDLVEVEVQSQWYLGWAEYFQQLAQTTSLDNQLAVEIDHANNTAILRLVVPVERRSVTAGIIGGASGEDTVIDNNPTVLSYDSTDGAFTKADAAPNGTIRLAGDLTVNNNACFAGDVEVGGDVELNQKTGCSSANAGDFDGDETILGNLSYGSLSNPSEATLASDNDYVNGTASDNPAVTGIEDMDGVVTSRIVDAKDTNDNAKPTNPIVGDDLVCNTSCAFTEGGTYYIENFDLNGDMTIDFAGISKDLNIAVNDSMDIGGYEINIENTLGNDHRVNFYVNSEKSGDCAATGGGTSGCDLHVDNGKVSVDADKSNRSWIFMKSDADVLFEGGSGKFTGVVYGPGGNSKGTEIGLGNGFEVYGGLVGYVNEMGQNTVVAYDEALANTETVTTRIEVPKLTFLHVAVHEVCVKSRDSEVQCLAAEFEPQTPPKPGKTITLDASSSIGPIDEYEWEISETPDGAAGESFSDTSGETIDHAFQEEGQYRVNLTVRNTGSGGRETRETSYEVFVDVSYNDPPTANLRASPSSVATGDTVSFDASDSFDADGTVSDHDWEIINTGKDSLDAYDGDTEFDHTFSDAHNYEVQVTVTDDDGGPNGTDTATTFVTVGDTGDAPHVAIDGSSQSATSASVEFTAYDGNDDLATATAEFHNSTYGVVEEKTVSVPGDGGSGQTISVTSADANDINAVRVRVDDAMGNVDTDVASAPMSEPIAGIDAPGSADVGDSVTFTSNSVDDSNMDGYQWSIVSTPSGVSDGFSDRSGDSTSHAFSASGDYVVELEVTEDGVDEDRDHALHEITVGSGVPSASFTASPNPASTGETITFDASSSSNADTYTWDFGDGTTVGPNTADSTTHSYLTTGSYAVELTVENTTSGKTDKTTVTVEVTDAPRINSFDATDKSSGGKAKYDVEWDVSDPNGDFKDVTFELIDSSGSVVDSATSTDATGTGGSSITLLDSGGEGDSYGIKLEATDDAGNTVTCSTTDTADKSGIGDVSGSC